MDLLVAFFLVKEVDILPISGFLKYLMDLEDLNPFAILLRLLLEKLGA